MLHVQAFAEKQPNIAFTHIYPGVVRTSLLYGSNDWKLRLLSPLTAVIGHLAGVSAEECAEYMWRGMYASRAGWSRRDDHGEEVKAKSSPYPPEAMDQLWEHTLKATS